MAKSYQGIQDLSESLQLLADAYKKLHGELEALKARKVSPDTHDALMFWAHSFLSYLKEIDPHMEREQFLQEAETLVAQIGNYYQAAASLNMAIAGVKTALDAVLTSLGKEPS